MATHSRDAGDAGAADKSTACRPTIGTPLVLSAAMSHRCACRKARRFVGVNLRTASRCAFVSSLSAAAGCALSAVFSWALSAVSAFSPALSGPCRRPCLFLVRRNIWRRRRARRQRARQRHAIIDTSITTMALAGRASILHGLPVVDRVGARVHADQPGGGTGFSYHRHRAYRKTSPQARRPASRQASRRSPPSCLSAAYRACAAAAAWWILRAAARREKSGFRGH